MYTMCVYMCIHNNIKCACTRRRVVHYANLVSETSGSVPMSSQSCSGGCLHRAIGVDVFTEL